MPEIKPLGANPLLNHFRQPKIYLTLPSNGKFYNPADIEMTETGELPVFPMTARDEIAFKTPDALLNGQSTVDVIQSCVPNIKNAWALPSLDLDAILIAIRIATFGEAMDITTVIPGINESRDYSLDLSKLLEQVSSSEFEDTVVSGDLIVKLRPLTYKEWTQSALKTFEEQRVFAIANDADMPEIDKVAQFNQSFKKLTEITVGTILSSIVSIEVDNIVVSDKRQIQEFVENADREFYNKVSTHIETQKENFSIKPMTIQTTPEEQQLGAPETFEMPVTFDQSHFFG